MSDHNDVFKAAIEAVQDIAAHDLRAQLAAANKALAEARADAERWHANYSNAEQECTDEREKREAMTRLLLQIFESEPLRLELESFGVDGLEEVLRDSGVIE